MVVRELVVRRGRTLIRARWFESRTDRWRGTESQLGSPCLLPPSSHRRVHIPRVVFLASLLLVSPIIRYHAEIVFLRRKWHAEIGSRTRRLFVGAGHVSECSALNACGRSRRGENCDEECEGGWIPYCATRQVNRCEIVRVRPAASRAIVELFVRIWGRVSVVLTTTAVACG